MNFTERYVLVDHIEKCFINASWFVFYSVFGTGSLGAVRAVGSLYERSSQPDPSSVTSWYPYFSLPFVLVSQVNLLVGSHALSSS